MLKLDFMQF